MISYIYSYINFCAKAVSLATEFVVWEPRLLIPWVLVVSRLKVTRCFPASVRLGMDGPER